MLTHDRCRTVFVDFLVCPKAGNKRQAALAGEGTRPDCTHDKLLRACVKLAVATKGGDKK